MRYELVKYADFPTYRLFCRRGGGYCRGNDIVVVTEQVDNKERSGATVGGVIYKRDI